MMKSLKYSLGLLLTIVAGSSAFAQGSSSTPDSVSQRIRYQDSVATAQDLRINAVTLTDSATRASINAALRSSAATTTPPTVAPVDSTYSVNSYTDGTRTVYDTGNIIDVLRHPKSDLTAVVAHRGCFQVGGVPENSLAAIQRASDTNMELIELDIKMSSDGVPVLSHDLTVGRTTVGGRGNYRLVSSFTNGELQTFRLVDKYGDATNQYIPTLEQALDYIHDHRISIVVALDIKDRAAARACWALIKRKRNAWDNPAYNWVIIKMNATVYNYPSDVAYDLPGLLKPQDPSNPNGPWVKDFYYDKLLYIPVYTTNMSDKLDCLESFRDFAGQPFFVAVEINFKQGGGILTDLMAEAYRNRIAGHEHTRCIFNALPDATSRGSDLFWSSDGYHTYRLSDLYWPPANKPAWHGQRDTDDKRGDWNFLINDPNNFKMITTDLPNTLANHLGTVGKRNISYYRPHPDGINDEVDPHGTPSNSPTSSNARMSATTLRASDPVATALGVGVYPNPTSGNLTVGLNQEKEGTVLFRITDQTGRTVLSQKRSLPAGMQQVALPNLRANGARPGLYLLQVMPSNSQPRQTFKVQVN